MNKEWALSIQGGGQRAIFACGVVDVLIKEGLFASEVYGCSAGNWIGLNYIQKKQGAAKKLFLDTKTKDVLSPFSFLEGGSMIDFGHYFDEKKNRNLNKKAIAKSPMDYYAVATDVVNCVPIYVSKKDPLFYDGLEASCSLAVFTRKPKMVGSIPALDGGYVERIPFLKPLKEGKKVVVISNREKGFRFPSLKEHNEKMVGHRFKKYPKFIECYQNSHVLYHEQLRLLEEEETKGNVFVIYAPQPMDISNVCRDQDVLRDAYELGVRAAKQILPKLKDYLRD